MRRADSDADQVESPPAKTPGPQVALRTQGPKEPTDSQCGRKHAARLEFGLFFGAAPERLAPGADGARVAAVAPGGVRR